MNSSWKGEPKPPVSEPVASVLDASAVLAALFREPGAERVVRALERGAAMSPVNVAEVVARLSQSDWTEGAVTSVFAELGIEIIPFDRATALLSGAYRRRARHLAATDWNAS